MFFRSCYQFSHQSRIVTGIQPTGNLTIGNYLGSISNLLHFRSQYPSSATFLFIADLHSLTTAFDNDHSNIKFEGKIGQNTLQIAKIILGSGINLSDNFHLFVQSHVKEHAELCWILGCIGPQHWLNMMIQYKEKSNQNSSLGIYSYPVLMAADILLYKANFVPVGEDQKQHLQLTKRYAQRFNQIINKQFFPVPNCILSKSSKVMSLTDPEKKMSKSDPNPRSRINIIDSHNEINEKIRRAVTDKDGSIITYDPVKRKGLANLIRLFSQLKGFSYQEVVSGFQGKGIKQFKQQLASALTNKISQIQYNMNNLSDEQTLQFLKRGEQQARKQASKTVSEVKELLKLLR